MASRTTRSRMKRSIEDLSWGGVASILRRSILEIVLIALCVFLAIRQDAFLTTGNLLNVLRSVSMQGVIAFGMTMVIVCGEIDLSVGSHTPVTP